MWLYIFYYIVLCDSWLSNINLMLFFSFSVEAKVSNWSFLWCIEYETWMNTHAYGKYTQGQIYLVKRSELTEWQSFVFQISKSKHLTTTRIFHEFMKKSQTIWLISKIICRCALTEKYCGIFHAQGEFLEEFSVLRKVSNISSI